MPFCFLSPFPASSYGLAVCYGAQASLDLSYLPAGWLCRLQITSLCHLGGSGLCLLAYNQHGPFQPCSMARLCTARGPTPGRPAAALTLMTLCSTTSKSRRRSERPEQRLSPLPLGRWWCCGCSRPRWWQALQRWRHWTCGRMGSRRTRTSTPSHKALFKVRGCRHACSVMVAG